jgi:hypothetical protein
MHQHHLSTVIPPQHSHQNSHQHLSSGIKSTSARSSTRRQHLSTVLATSTHQHVDSISAQSSTHQRINSISTSTHRQLLSTLINSHVTSPDKHINSSCYQRTNTSTRVNRARREARSSITDFLGVSTTGQLGHIFYVSC